jgi:hypothetical protein
MNPPSTGCKLDLKLNKNRIFETFLNSLDGLLVFTQAFRKTSGY